MIMNERNKVKKKDQKHMRAAIWVSRDDYKLIKLAAVFEDKSVSAFIIDAVMRAVVEVEKKNNYLYSSLIDNKAIK